MVGILLGIPTFSVIYTLLRGDTSARLRKKRLTTEQILRNSPYEALSLIHIYLTPYIHALETGLSSDPPMNWRISALDSYTLISNSDAHSPAKLGLSLIHI